MVSGAPKTIIIAPSKITNHRTAYSNNEKVWNSARIMTMRHKDMKWDNDIGKIAPINSLIVGCHKLQFVKNQYLWSAIMRNILKWVMTVYDQIYIFERLSWLHNREILELG